jgi:hypothetical protein
LVEVSPLFVELARKAASESLQHELSDEHWKMKLTAYLEVAKSKPRTLADVRRRSLRTGPPRKLYRSNSSSPKSSGRAGASL